MNNLGRRLVNRDCNEHQRLVTETCNDHPCPKWSSSEWSEVMTVQFAPHTFVVYPQGLIVVLYTVCILFPL